MCYKSVIKIISFLQQWWWAKAVCISVQIPLNLFVGVQLRIYQIDWGRRRQGTTRPEPRFNIKMPSYQYRKSHCGDKTVVRLSYLHNGISYAGKMTSLYWIRVQNNNVFPSKRFLVFKTFDCSRACNGQTMWFFYELHVLFPLQNCYCRAVCNNWSYFIRVIMSLYYQRGYWLTIRSSSKPVICTDNNRPPSWSNPTQRNEVENAFERLHPGIFWQIAFEILPHGRQDRFILHGQCMYHDYWCPGQV